jgi:hypothetical protein
VKYQTWLWNFIYAIGVFDDTPSGGGDEMARWINAIFARRVDSFELHPQLDSEFFALCARKLA